MNAFIPPSSHQSSHEHWALHASSLLLGGESDFEERANDTLKCLKRRRVDGQIKEPQDCQIWPFLCL